MSDEPAVDVRGTYRVDLRPPQTADGLGRFVTTARVVGSVLAVLWAAALVVRLWRWDALAGAVALGALAVLALGLVRLARRGVALTIDDDGVLLPGLRGQRRLRWSEVESVPAVGRFADTPHVVLADQRVVHLPGVPPTLVPHLQAFAELRRRGEAVPAAERPEPQQHSLDPSDLVGVYPAGAPALRTRGSRIGTGIAVLVTVALVTWTVDRVVRAEAEPGSMLPLVLILGVNAAMGFRPPLTRVTPEALVVRPGAFASRRHAWADVASVRPPGRWDDHSTAVLRDGRLVPLPGMPVEVARHLAAVVSPEDAAPAAPPAPAPGRQRPPARPPVVRGAEDEGWDGPFRRGRPRG